jgi:hypothetical protein
LEEWHKPLDFGGEVCNTIRTVKEEAMALTQTQLTQLVETYAERIVDDMDTKTLMCFVFDVIVENLSMQSEEEVISEIASVYDDETADELIASVN